VTGSTQIRVPPLGESVSEATVGRWNKQAGDAVQRDEVLVELETEKISLAVVAPEDGVLSEIAALEGAIVAAAAVLGTIRLEQVSPPRSLENEPVRTSPTVEPPGEESPRLEHQASLTTDVSSGTAPLLTRPQTPNIKPLDREERVRMSRLRQTIARRLKEAQNTAAILTTFNEVDMSAVRALRAQYQQPFEQRHGVKLGFMSFFVKACVAALKAVPDVNAVIEGSELVYRKYYDIGVAVGTGQGLVVPVVRDADTLSLAQIEGAIALLGKKARAGELTLQDLQGGTFSISNGGVYGSLLSTPILNAPQSGILGMHNIQERPVALGGQVVIRPMMYLALSYDHRVVDGQGAVTFLARIKEQIADPQRLLMDL
jgi:2-oxoglutarate dehydrogenase E2 component (dihydrolipoamide succinyltransferase)